MHDITSPSLTISHSLVKDCFTASAIDVKNESQLLVNDSLDMHNMNLIRASKKGEENVVKLLLAERGMDVNGELKSVFYVYCD